MALRKRHPRVRYDDLGIHEQMLCDAAPCAAYRDAIVGNCAYFDGRVVVDVGAGTGLEAGRRTGFHQ